MLGKCPMSDYNFIHCHSDKDGDLLLLTLAPWIPSLHSSVMDVVPQPSSASVSRTAMEKEYVESNPDPGEKSHSV